MTIRIFLIAAFVVGLVGGCSIEPEPQETRIVSRVGATVVLEAEPLPTDEIYWTFYSYPMESIVNFVSLTPASAAFMPRLEGEYIIDRWAVSGPSGVWLDRFIVEVNEAVPGQE